MLQKGIINPHINYELARLCHGDKLLLADAGMPVSAEAARIDLALTLGDPELPKVLRVLMEQMLVEKVFIAEEIKEASPALYAEYEKMFAGIPIELIPHREMLKAKEDVNATIRTGDNRYHYASVILQAGCPY